MKNSFVLLSRKIIISVEIVSIAIVFLFMAKIYPSEWGIIFSGIFLSYLGGRTIDKSRNNDKPVGLKERKEALFTREFVLSIIAILMTSSFIFMKNSEGQPLIDGTTWVQVNTAIGGFYNVFNPLQKHRHGHNNFMTEEPNDEQSA